jgi:hypothetical protein
VINSGRGDPIDGGNRIQAEVALVLDQEALKRANFLYLAAFKTSDLIIHTPPITVSTTIPQQAECYIQDNGAWISHLRHTDQVQSFEGIQSWPFKYLKNFIDHTPVMVHSRYEIHENTPRFSVNSYSKNLGNNSSAIVALSDDKYAIQISGATTRMEIKPGSIGIKDIDLGNKVLMYEDSNICYRALTAINPETGKVVSFNVSIEMMHDLETQETLLELIISRAVFDNEVAFRRGTVSHMDLYRVLFAGREP